MRKTPGSFRPDNSERSVTGDADATLILDVRSLFLDIVNDRGVHSPVQGLYLPVARGGAVGLVGESGSGKTLTGLAILGLLPTDISVAGGSIWFDGRRIDSLGEREYRGIRGRGIAMLFQNAKLSLNPLISVGNQIAEVVRIHEDVSRSESFEMAISLLDSMGIPNAKERANSYPHQFSGGMAQRASLARALACRPSILVADEPTTGLDATLQGQIVDLLEERLGASGTALLLISHDISLASRLCTDFVVVYAGMTMEAGSREQILDHPRHPYTAELVRAHGSVTGSRMYALEGSAPTRFERHQGCPFAPRCRFSTSICESEVPQLRIVAERSVACHHAGPDLQ